MRDDHAETEEGVTEGGVIFPQLSALNWPSSLLPVWQALQALGVPESQIRFVPEVGHFAAPEVTPEAADEDPDWDGGRGPQRHPLGPRLDAEHRRITADAVDPAAMRPRLKVSVRADTVTGQGPDGQVWEREVGRLAHFLPPLLAGLPGAGEPFAGETPVTRLVRQICGTYPELTAALPPAPRHALQGLAVFVERAWGAEDAAARARWLTQAAQALARRPDRDECRRAFEGMLAKLFPPDGVEATFGEWRRAVVGLGEWVGPLFGADAGVAAARAAEAHARLGPDAVRLGAAALQSLAAALSWETPRERERLVRELVEIMTTEAFSAVAAQDHLWGFGWIHGAVADFDAAPEGAAPDPLRDDGLLLSVMGGPGHRTLLLTLLRGWASQGECLGVGPEELAVLNAGQRDELWALASWRRVAGDPIGPLEIALRRLVHPEARILWDPDADVTGGFGTLLAQPGRTALLNGPARLRMPGVVILMPLAEDDGAVAVKARLALILRVLLPVTLRVEVIWREAVARLGDASYLRHPFQGGARLAPSEGAVRDEEVTHGIPSTRHGG